jgi:glyoxylase-like metal-dependent hydrolase (beta-lactamase superfamily II)/rhodanese-related sulfurtransferase
MFDTVSSTYTYLLASRPGTEALLIDPVLDKVDRYIQLLEELDLHLVKAVDTHVHADHITALGALRDRTRCITVMGTKSQVDTVSMRVSDGETIDIEGISLGVLHTPGHTSDSYCFTMPDRVFTGDTLLIRGTGRTDFQHGSSLDEYDSIFNKLLALPDDTLVYPGHDYKGDTVSTIGEERRFNPRLQVTNATEYAEIMNNLNLANPKMMDIAVPANLKIGLSQAELENKGWGLTCKDAISQLGEADAIWVDLRDTKERKQNGVVPGSVHAPYPDLDKNLKPGGLLHELAASTGKRLVFYCAYGERSGMAVQSAQEAGMAKSTHVTGGMDAWRSCDGPIESPA